MIPRLIHQIWCGPNKLPNRERGFTQKLRNMHLDYEYRLWTDEFIEDELKRMPEYVAKEYQRFYADGQYAFCADVFRIWVVYEFGGWYLDIDFDPIKKLDDFLSHDAFFCYHPNTETDFTVVNGVFGAHYHHPSLWTCLLDIKDNIFWCGPEWFGRTIKRHYEYEYETIQTIFKKFLNTQNICYFDWEDFYKNYAKHVALYSWSDHYIPEK